MKKVNELNEDLLCLDCCMTLQFWCRSLKKPFKRPRSQHSVCVSPQLHVSQPFLWSGAVGRKLNYCLFYAPCFVSISSIPSSVVFILLHYLE